MERWRTSAAFALLLAATPLAALAQQAPGGPTTPPEAQGMMPEGGEDMVRQDQGERTEPGERRMRGHGHHGMMRHPDRGMRHHGMVGSMRMMMILIDTDGDGALSLEEAQAAHARVFQAVDADDNGLVTTEEMRAFHTGMGSSDGE